MSDFTNWLDAELKARNWTPADLSKKSGVSRSTLTLLFKGERNPGAEVCQKIARAFGVDEDIVFVKAGIMNPRRKEEITPFQRYIIQIINENLVTKEQQEGFNEILQAYIKGTRRGNK